MPHLLVHLEKVIADPDADLDKDHDLIRYALLLLAHFRVTLHASTKKNTNVLQHMMGYFKKQLSPEEKAELLEVIDQYHEGLAPLLVPLTLLKHYVRKYDQQYLQGQVYLSPHPAQLMLRNHVEKRTYSRPMETSLEILAPASAAWKLLTDTSRWSEWGTIGLPR